MHERFELVEQDKRNALELAQAKVTSELQEVPYAKDAEIKDLKENLYAGEATRQLALAQAQRVVEKESDELANELRQTKHEKQTAFELAEANHSE